METLDYMRVIGSLLAVLAVIWVAALALRRSGMAAIEDGPLKLVQTIALGTRERLVVLNGDGVQLVLAVSPQGITRIATLPQASQAVEPALDRVRSLAP